MFEGLVSTVLNSYLGLYVNDLDADQLRLAVWSGTEGLLFGFFQRAASSLNRRLPPR
jgi:hypothetical protein